MEKLKFGSVLCYAYLFLPAPCTFGSMQTACAHQRWCLGSKITCYVCYFRVGSGKKKEKSNDYRSKTTREIISIAGINILHCLRYLSYIFCSLDWDMTQHSYRVRLNKDSNLEITKQMKDWVESWSYEWPRENEQGVADNCCSFPHRVTLAYLNVWPSCK